MNMQKLAFMKATCFIPLMASTMNMCAIKPSFMDCLKTVEQLHLYHSQPHVDVTEEYDIFCSFKMPPWSPRLWGTYWRYWSKLQCRWVAQGGARRANFFIRQEYCYWNFKNIITKIPSLCAFKISKIPIKRVWIRWLTMGDASLNQLPAFTLRATRFTVFLNLISRW